MKESTRVLLALLAAIIVGLLVAASHSTALIHAADAVAPIGTLWVNGIRMTVIPLVVSLLITGVASVSDIKSIGRLGGRTLLTFVLLLIGVAAIVIPVALAMFKLLPPHGALELPPGAIASAARMREALCDAAMRTPRRIAAARARRTRVLSFITSSSRHR